MGYEVRVIRQSDSGEETEIRLEEWDDFIKADPDFVPPPPGSTNAGSKNLFYLPTGSSNPDDWPWIAWSNGRIHTRYCELSVMKKLGQMASDFRAVVMSDDGDIWTICENGQVVIEGF